MDESVESLLSTARKAGFRAMAVVPYTAFTAWGDNVRKRPGYDSFKSLPGNEDARTSLPEAKSIVMGVWDYSAVPVPPSYRGRVARLYLSRSDLPDYGGQPATQVMEGFFGHLGWRFTRRVPRRETAVAAGLLVQRRNCLGFLPGGHSFVALFAWAVEAELKPWRAWFDGGAAGAGPAVGEPLDFVYPPERRDPCGDCRLCLDACPTGALVAPFTVDPRRCIDRNNSLSGEAVPRDIRSRLGGWVYGCDACQEACPHNRRVVRAGSGGGDPAAATEGFTWPDLSLEGLSAVTAEEYEAVWSSLFVFNSDRDDLRRNAIIALGNLGDRAAEPSLRAALADPGPIIRGHAAWALGRLATPSAREALRTALAIEADATAREEMTLALADEGRSATIHD